MRTLIARHRAATGIVAFAAIALFYTLPEETGDPWGDVAMATLDVLLLGLVILGAWAMFTSPYMSILHREAPLKRAMTGVSELDERELALRDRAAGMTYYLFATFNLLAVIVLGLLLKYDAIVLEGDVLLDVMLPYAYFCLFLPVLMLEWFEPSSLWVVPVAEEEEEA
jgi:hypothetical protein